MLESRQQLDWNLPVVGGTGFGGSNVAALVGPDALENVTMWTWAVAVTDREPVPDRFRETALPAIKTHANGTLEVAANLYAGGYDALMVIEAAARTAGSTGFDEDARRASELEREPAVGPEVGDAQGVPVHRGEERLRTVGGRLAVPRQLNDQGQVPAVGEAAE